MEKLEQAARAAHYANSFRDYKPGAAAERLKSYISEAEAVAADALTRLKKHGAPADRAQKVSYLLDNYKKKIFAWLAEYYTNEAACPSIMISGGGNFPTRKKERQNARRRTIAENHPVYILDKIRAIGANAGTIYSDDSNAIDRLRTQIESASGANKRRLQSRLLELSPEEVKAGKQITVNGKEATFKNIVGLFDSAKHYKSEITGEFYFDLPLVFSDGKRKYNQFLSITTNETGTARRSRTDWNKFITLTDRTKFLLIIQKISGSGNKAVIYSILKDLLPQEATDPEKEQKKTGTINGEAVQIERNREAMRLQIFFEGIPQPETRQKMKMNGFRWAPSFQAWQRLLNTNAEFALRRLQAN